MLYIKCTLLWFELAEWSKADKNLMQTVKRGSTRGIFQLASGRKNLEPAKLDPNSGTTAYVL